MIPFQRKQIALMRQMESRFTSGTTASSIVSMQSDYRNDNQLCLTCVSKIPKDVAVTIQTKILRNLSAIEPNFYYYPTESLHITIQNIRIINNPPHFGPSEIAKVARLLSEFIPQFEPFPFILSGLIRMPTSISVIALVTPAYDRCIKLLRKRLVSVGVADDKKYFSPDVIFANATICRYTHKPSEKFMQEVEKHSPEFFGKMTAREVSLIETNAGFYPAKTKVFGTYRFKNPHG